MAWILGQVTIPTGGGPIQLAAPATAQAQIFCRQILVQNNAAHNARLGDATVSSTKGVLLLTASGGGGGSFNSGPASPVYNSYLSDLWVFGTAADVIDFFYNT